MYIHLKNSKRKLHLFNETSEYPLSVNRNTFEYAFDPEMPESKGILTTSGILDATRDAIVLQGRENKIEA